MRRWCLITPIIQFYQFPAHAAQDLFFHLRKKLGIRKKAHSLLLILLIYNLIQWEALISKFQKSKIAQNKGVILCIQEWQSILKRHPSNIITLRRHCFLLAATSLVVFFDKPFSWLIEQSKKKVVREKNVQNFNLKFTRIFWRQSFENQG